MVLQCHVCGKEYKSKFNLNYHVAHHFDARPFVCDFVGCSNAYKTKADLSQHQKSHEKALGLTFRCGDCQTYFDSSKKLNVHRKEVHTVKEALSWCELCNRDFRNLKAHKKMVHVKLRPYSCDIDGKLFARMHGLLRHIESVHLNLKPFACEQCAKRFKEKSALKKHQKTHQKFFRDQKKHLKPLEVSEYYSEDEEIALKLSGFKCSSCYKTFSNEQNLQNHKEKHHSDAKFRCDNCGNHFTSKQMVSMHLRSCQPGEPQTPVEVVKKFYRCGICKKMVSSKNSLERHKSIVHFANYPFMCELCSERFRDISSLNNHLSRYHNQDVSKPTDLACSTCGKKYSLQLYLEKHEIKCRLSSNRELVEESTFIKEELEDSQMEEVLEEYEVEIEEDPIDIEIKFEEICEDDEASIPDQDIDISLMAGVMEEITKIKCKLCSLEFLTSDEFRAHFVTNHVKLKNVAISAAKTKTLEVPLAIEEENRFEEVSSDQLMQETKMNETEYIEELEVEELIEEDGTNDYSENEEELSEGEPDNLKERELSRMFNGETLNTLENLFECTVCQQEFEKLQELKLHCVRSHRVKKYKCRHCHRSFTDLQNLRLHWKQSHWTTVFDKSFHTRSFPIPNERFECEFCSNILATNDSLKRHIYLVHSSEREEFFCDQCGESFRDVRTLKNHIANIHTETLLDGTDGTEKLVTKRRKTTKLIQCEDCGDEVFGQVALKVHRWVKHFNIKIVGKRRFHCLICREVMNCRASARRHHFQVHDGGKVLVRPCLVCNQAFQVFEDFAKHIAVEHQGANICLTCGNGFESKMALFVHTKQHRSVPDDEKKMVCDLCGFRAQQKVSVESHMINAHGANKRKAFSGTCELCGMSFANYPSFQNHRNSHRGREEKHKCSFCDKTYRNGRDIRRHELIHTNPSDKLYKCEYEGCTKQYQSYCSFHWHVKYAHKENRKQCKYCSEVMSSRDKLISHIETVHPGVRKHSCGYCEKTFATQAASVRHIKTCEQAAQQ